MEKGAVIKHEIEKAPKTGSWGFMTPKIDKSKCIGCGTCVPYCPEAAIEITTSKSKKTAKVDYNYCKGCGVCSTLCPTKAIIMKKK